MKSIFGWRIKEQMLSAYGAITGTILTIITCLIGDYIIPLPLWVILSVFSVAVTLLFILLTLDNEGFTTDKEFQTATVASYMVPINFVALGILYLGYILIFQSFERVDQDDIS